MSEKLVTVVVDNGAVRTVCKMTERDFDYLYDEATNDGGQIEGIEIQGEYDDEIQFKTAQEILNVYVD